jgi:hypothetical protein
MNQEIKKASIATAIACYILAATNLYEALLPVLQFSSGREKFTRMDKWNLVPEGIFF